MVDSDMDISGESDNDSSSVGVKRRRESVAQPPPPQETVAQIPMPPVASVPPDTGKRYISLKKRWLQNIEKEPKKKKVSLEAYRKRHVSGGESGESGRSQSDIDKPSTHLQLDAKERHRLAREERDRQSGKKLQKMTISDLEKRKVKLKEALKKIEDSTNKRKPSNLNTEAKSEFDKFMEKQSRWLQKRARQKQREAKLEQFASTVDMPDMSHVEEFTRTDFNFMSSVNKLSSPVKDGEHRKRERSRYQPRNTSHHVSSHRQKQVAVVRPRGQSELTSTLACLQKAKEEVQRQICLLKSPSDHCHRGTNSTRSNLSDTLMKSHSADKSDP